MPGKIIILSPHLDDAVLSCPQHIISWIKKGMEVTVCTVFSKSNDSREESIRKAEDRDTVSKLGCKYRHLDFLDFPFRSDREISFFRVISENPDQNLVAAVGESIKKLLEENSPAVLVSPLAAGLHVDHRITRMAANDLSCRKILYYEDRPYSLINEHIKFAVGAKYQPNSKFWEKFWLTGYVKNYEAEKEKEEVIRHYCELQNLKEIPERLKPVSILNNTDFDHSVLDIIGGYRSQIGDLYDNEELKKTYLVDNEYLWGKYD